MYYEFYVWSELNFRKFGVDSEGNSQFRSFKLEELTRVLLLNK